MNPGTKSKKKEASSCPVAYFENTDTLPDINFIDKAFIVPFYKDRVLMVKDEKEEKLKFLSARLLNGESLYKTFRREIYVQTGALLYHAKLVGMFSVYNGKNNLDTLCVPVYVGRASHIEKPLYSRELPENVLMRLEDAMEVFEPTWDKPNLNYFSDVLKKYR